MAKKSTQDTAPAETLFDAEAIRKEIEDFKSKKVGPIKRQIEELGVRRAEINNEIDALTTILNDLTGRPAAPAPKRRGRGRARGTAAPADLETAERVLAYLTEHRGDWFNGGQLKQALQLSAPVGSILRLVAGKFETQGERRGTQYRVK